jgi:flagellar biosynthesis protein FliR
MLQMQAVLGLFFAMGGHRLFLQTVARSFEQFPIGWFPYAAATATVIESLVRLTGMALSATLQVGAPVLVCVFTTHIGVAALARSLHAQTLHEEASAVKIWIGFCVLALTAATVLDTSWEVFARLLKGVGEVI